jgi:hypothetical protein
MSSQNLEYAVVFVTRVLRIGTGHQEPPRVR